MRIKRIGITAEPNYALCIMNYELGSEILTSHFPNTISTKTRTSAIVTWVSPSMSPAVWLKR